MRASLVVLVTLGTAALPGCFFEHRGSHGPTGGPYGHAEGPAVVEVELAYIYFPSVHAYFCESTDEWWVIEGGGWTRRRSRPVNIYITQQTPWVVVNIRGSRPHGRFTEHAAAYPAAWRPEAHMGPPPGHGWDRPGNDDRRQNETSAATTTGAPMTTESALAGHGSLVVTARYAQHLPENAEVAATRALEVSGDASRARAAEQK